MPISDDIVLRARKHRREAMETVLREVYPTVYRLAYALTGRAGAARQVLHDVLRRSLKVIPKWRKGMVPENWFYHHTVITSRAVTPDAPPAEQDVLARDVPPDIAADPAYVAFVRALRLLPRQQVEAFLLHQCEKLNTRLLGVAMDCSQDAAGKHLAAAQAALEQVSGNRQTYDELVEMLQRAYRGFVPPQETIAPAARRYVSRHLRPRQFRKVIQLLVLALLAVLAVIAWKRRRQIMEFIEPYIPENIQTTQPAIQSEP